MPYCPKCDMEFIEGITVCSDCGSALMESKEVADALKRQEQEETLARAHAEYQAQLSMGEDITDEIDDQTKEENATPSPAFNRRHGLPPTRVYVKKSEQYDDLKSSASAFFLVGGVLIVFSVLFWLDIISLPLGIIGKAVLSILGVVSLLVAVKTIRDAKNIKEQIGQEELQTQKLIQWFVDSYTGQTLDEQISREYGELIFEELSLKRFELIQDILVTNHDLSNPSYVDLLTEEIYSRLYPDS
ncbi:MAG: hypothetical protein HFG57_03335 [Lachnospiraceae bacterium]|nr:hypothetical protein [Lachnospiraceae bacterium]